mgnify:CR=1 FL=1
MNIGEDDLFMQRVMTRDNVSVILSPRASLREKMWGGMGWWMSQLRYFGSAFRFYPRAVKTFVRWEMGSRVLFFATVICALAVMPPEYKLAALLLAVIRYVVVALEVRRIGRGRHCRALLHLRPARPAVGRGAGGDAAPP